MISDFRFQISEQISDQNSEFRIQNSEFRFQISEFRFQISDLGYLSGGTAGVGFRI